MFSDNECERRTASSFFTIQSVVGNLAGDSRNPTPRAYAVASLLQRTLLRVKMGSG